MKFNLYTLTIIVMIFFKTNVLANYDKIFYDFQIKDISGNELNLKEFKNKVVLLVNTASYCGFTKQYSDLQKIWDEYRSRGLVVIGVPSNSFNQEKDNDKEIKKFCEVNFDINFPLSSITNVKGEDAHEIFKWAKKNYGNAAVPKWNFHKILINKEGKVQNSFNSFTKPTSNKILSEIEKIL